jgi:hypothetical protein
MNKTNQINQTSHKRRGWPFLNSLRVLLEPSVTSSSPVLLRVQDSFYTLRGLLDPGLWHDAGHFLTLFFRLDRLCCEGLSDWRDVPERGCAAVNVCHLSMR